MTARGVLFALTGAQDAALAAARGDDDEVAEFVGEVEEEWDEEWVCEADKAWDGLHHCLSDVTPQDMAILGGEWLYDGDDYIVTYVAAGTVPAVAAALAAVDEAWLRERYDRIDPDDYDGALVDGDFEYTWDFLVEARDFYRRAAEAGRSVIFTVDQ